MKPCFAKLFWRLGDYLYLAGEPGEKLYQAKHILNSFRGPPVRAYHEDLTKKLGGEHNHDGLEE